MFCFKTANKKLNLHQNRAKLKYSSQGKQLTLDIFNASLEKSLDPENRWYKLANAIPWDKIEIMYVKTLDNKHNGAGNKPARMIIGALIIKHMMSLSDEETIKLVAENPYMQYFVGLTEFSNIPIFDSSLFVYIRKRLGVDNINKITELLMQTQKENISNKKGKSDNEDKGDTNIIPNVPGSAASDSFTDEDGEIHSGNMIIDATCSDAEVKYPTDVEVLHDAVRISVRVIESLCKKT